MARRDLGHHRLDLHELNGSHLAWRATVPGRRAPVGHDEPVEPPGPEPEFGDPTRRTFLAQERTFLAWWRTAFAAIGVALAVGRLLPEIAHLPKEPFLVMGVGWGILAVGLVAFGLVRQRAGERAIRAGGYMHLSPSWLLVITLYTLALLVGTVVVMFIHA